MITSMTKRFVATMSATALVVMTITLPAFASTFNIIGTGSGSLQHNGTTRIDITDPNGDQVIDTTVWGNAPTVTGPNTVGTFNGPGNNGESWAKVFDSAVNAGGPWGSSTSKTCCDFTPGVSSVTMDSSAFSYTLNSYTLANGNDTPNRRPDGWRLFGSTDGFATSNVLLDTVVQSDVNWTAHNQVGEVTAFDNPSTTSFSSFRFIFDDSVSPNQFQLSEIEVLSDRAEVNFDNNVGTATVSDSELFGGTLVFEFDDTMFDQLTGPGTFDLNGATIELEELSAAAPGTYQLLDGAITGTLGGIIAPSNFDTSNLAIDGSVTVNAVPEPATVTIWALIGAGLFGFGYRRLRNRRTE